jgi:hypothetical protein
MRWDGPKAEWRAIQDKTANTYVVELPYNFEHQKEPPRPASDPAAILKPRSRVPTGTGQT